MTKLDSVNFVMTAVGLRAISALETGTASTAADIEREIDRRVKLVCAESWHFNKRVNVVLQPDVNGHILIAQIGDVFTGGYITGISASATPESNHPFTGSTIPRGVPQPVWAGAKTPGATTTSP